MKLYDILGNEVEIGGSSNDSYSSISELQRKFQNKNVIWLGDSIHAYSQWDGVTIPYLFQFDSGAVCYNWCQGGTTMAKVGADNYQPYSAVGMVDALLTGDFSKQEQYQEDRNFVKQVAEMKSFDMSKADYIIIEFGTNDALKGVTLDNSDNPLDITTTGGALRYIIKQLQTKYPKLNIALCNVQKGTGWLDAEHSKPYDMQVQTNKINEICKEYGLPVIDIYNQLGLNEYTSKLLLQDNLHRTHDGKLKQVKIIENFMVQTF